MPSIVFYDEIQVETEKAVLIRVDKSTYWIPRFAIEDWDDKEKTMTIRQDIAVDKGLA